MKENTDVLNLNQRCNAAVSVANAVQGPGLWSWGRIRGRLARPILPEFELEIFPHQVLSVSPLRVTFTFGT